MDGRTLKVTGRTEQFNFKAREGLKRRVSEAAAAEGVTIAEWMERAGAQLTRGEHAKAEVHLAALERICLIPCAEYEDLKRAIQGYVKVTER